MLIDDLQNKMIGAMKGGDKARADIYRNLLSEIKNAKIDNPDMSGEDEVAVIRKEVKKRKDAIEAYNNAGRGDRAAEEEAELKILQEFLPAEMSDSELQSLVHEVIIYLKAEGMADMGKVMGEAMKRVQGKASGDRVSAIVKEKLTNGNS